MKKFWENLSSDKHDRINSIFYWHSFMLPSSRMSDFTKAWKHRVINLNP